MGRNTHPNRGLIRTGIALFFVMGLLVGMLVSCLAVLHGLPVPLAIFMGSVSGAVGSWLIFFVAYHR